MNTLAQKVAALLPELEARGPVYLFALGEREDIHEWEVLLSADWADAGYFAAVRLVADALVPGLDVAELTMFAGILIVPVHEADIQNLSRSLENVSPEDEQVVYWTLMGMEVRRAFVFRARRPQGAQPAEPAVATAGT